MASRVRRVIGRILPAFLLGCSLPACCTGAVLAADRWAEPDIRAALTFQKSLKVGDRAAVARMLVPMRLDFPLPPIKSTAEFLAHWDEFFDRSITQQLLRDAPAQAGWQGVTIGNGLAWFDNGRVFSFNPRTNAYQKRWDEAKRREAETLYPSLRNYTKVAVICSTKSKHIRIQQHGRDYRYFAWPKGAGLNQKPELALKGQMQFDGNGGNETYTFENNGFRYRFEKVFVCGENCDDTLTVSKGTIEISSQACR